MPELGTDYAVYWVSAAITPQNNRRAEMPEHDGDITRGTNSYYGDEAAAKMAAVEIERGLVANAISAQQVRVEAQTCVKCSGSLVWEAFALGVSGSGVWCQVHLEEYHKKPLADILGAKRRANAVVHYCARCGRRGHWVSGAGQALCIDHEDDY